jgi:hypothetical protein
LRPLRTSGSSRTDALLTLVAKALLHRHEAVRHTSSQGEGAKAGDSMITVGETLVYIGVILLFFAVLAGVGELLARRDARLLRRRVRENRRRTRTQA